MNCPNEILIAIGTGSTVFTIIWVLHKSINWYFDHEEKIKNAKDRIDMIDERLTQVRVDFYNFLESQKKVKK